MSEQESKKQILKSTGVLGFSQVIIILIGVIRVKVLAVLLGASGVGITGLYQSTIDLLKSITGFGLSYSAVRDIAASAASQDEKQVATTVLVLRRWVWATGLLGMLTAILLCRQLSQLAFGTAQYATGIIILSVSLLLSSVAGGQSALLQGFRKIGDLAKANALSALLGLAGAAFIYAVWGLKGIVPALLFSNLSLLLVNWFYSRKIRVDPVRLPLAEIFQKGKSMAKLGFFLSLTGLATTGTMYLVRSFVMKQGDLAAVGHFIAAWTISSMYISAIFSAMSADFFPRLSGVQNDRDAMAKMVNEQTEVALLITAPIITGMVCFIDLVVRIFYSRDFGPTALILYWQLAGDFFKVLAWPMGFIILAKGKGRLYIGTELFWNLLFCAGVYFGWSLLGLQVTGIAFLMTYVFYMIVLFLIARHLVGFSWSYKVRQAIVFFLPLIAFAVLSVKYLQGTHQLLAGAVLTLLAGIYSVYHLKDLVGFNRLAGRLKWQK